MSDSTQYTSPVARIAILIVVTGAALVAYLVLLHQWQVAESGSTSLAPLLLGFGIALCAGLAVGLWWPTQRDQEVQRSDQEAEAETVAAAPVATVHTDDTPTVSALMEEEHIPGSSPAAAPAAPVAPMAPASPARAEPVHPSVAIDDRPRDEAMSAKDEVIRSLENIVKDNRDRWADFEQDRDALEAKIKNLESELRIAQQIIENGSDDPDAFVSPQVLSRI